MKNGNRYEDKYFKLTADIDLSGVNNWTPIGDQYSSSFRGIFDGNNANYKISNLTITGGDNVGLFGYIRGGTIKNVSLVNANIRGSSNVGGIVGLNYGGTVQNCTVDAQVSGNKYVGGIVGWNEGTIDNCTVTVNIGGRLYVGGIVGYNDFGGQVKNCTVDAQVSGNSYVGGLVGHNYTARTVIQNNTFHSNAGAVGKDFSRMTSNNNRVYALPLDGVTAKLMNGDEYKVIIGDKTYYKPDAMLALTLDITSNDDFDYITGFKGLTKNSDGSFIYTIGKPLEFEGYAKIGSLGFDKSDNSYTIATREQLEEFRDYVNSGHDCNDCIFKLTADIDLSGIANWTPIGATKTPFMGTFDGQGYKISNLTITGNNDGCGLFANVLDCTIKNRCS